MTSWTIAAPARADRHPSALAILTAFLRRLYLPSIAIAAVTVSVAWVAVVHLAQHGQLGSVLSAGRAELIGPALVGLIVAAVVCEQIWPAERRPALSRGQVHDAFFLVLHVAMVVPLMTLLGVGFAALIAAHAGWVEVSWTASWPTWLVVGRDAGRDGWSQLARALRRPPVRAVVAAARGAPHPGGAERSDLVPGAPASFTSPASCSPPCRSWC